MAAEVVAGRRWAVADTVGEHRLELLAAQRGGDAGDGQRIAGDAAVRTAGRQRCEGAALRGAHLPLDGRRGSAGGRRRKGCRLARDERSADRIGDDGDRGRKKAAILQEFESK